MCGIAGYMSTDGAAPGDALLDAFDAALAHRGPDGSGRFKASGFAMIQRRLAIIDLETGDQPLREPGGAALVANAEIYDYIEQREALAGVDFATQSDCEVPLHLYRRDGAGFAEGLRGMYAIALYDPASERLLLARDPFGIKPLYYLETAGGLAFASEPQALFAAGLATPRINTRARDAFLQLQFTPGRETIFEGVKRVLPGETLIVAKGRIVERLRRAALPDGGPEACDEADAERRLDAALEDSVAVHQRADVPYGMFLSGGVDSTALLTMMARLNRHPVRAYTVGFPDSRAAHDEREQARAVARGLGAEHVEVEFREADFWALLPKVAACLDDPVADYAALPTYKLAAAAARELKVVLTGEGGDELFAGYGRYRSAIRPWWRGGKAFRGRGIFDRLGVLRDEPVGWRDGIAAAEAIEDRDGRSPLQVVQAVDCADWLPHDLLTKLDRCLMAHGVEGRTPLLDPAVAAVAFRLPDGLKLRDGRGKWLLRHWLAKRQPGAGWFARKRGFTVPVADWIARQGARLGPLVAAQPGIAEICRPDAVKSLFANPRGRRPGFAAWVLLFYALWHRRHLLGLAPAGDVFESLSSRD